METINTQKIVAGLGKVAVLMGGDSAEREVSLNGGQAVCEGLQRLGVDVELIDVDEDLVTTLQRLKPDRVFNMLHGRGGEDGVIQGMLEYMGIPYTGSGVLASALALDKVRSKQIWLQQGLATANFALLEKESNWEAIINQLGSVVVKPVLEGSSIGISIVHKPEELLAAFDLAHSYDSQVMAESYIEGDEFSVVILGQDALPAIHLNTDNSFFDYEAKYIDEDTIIVCPAPLDATKTDELNMLVLAAYKALSCEGIARVDVMQDKAGDFYLLEANTVPGMTQHSFVPVAAKACGIGFDELLLRILTAKADWQD